MSARRRRCMCLICNRHRTRVSRMCPCATRRHLHATRRRSYATCMRPCATRRCIRATSRCLHATRRCLLVTHHRLLAPRYACAQAICARARPLVARAKSLVACPISIVGKWQPLVHMRNLSSPNPRSVVAWSITHCRHFCTCLRLVARSDPSSQEAWEGQCL